MGDALAAVHSAHFKGGDPPNISKGILHSCRALLIWLVLGRGYRDRAEFDCPAIDCIDVLNINIVPRKRRGGMRRVTYFKHNGRIANAGFGME